MQNSTTEKAKKHGASALGLALAATLGAGLGLIFSPKDGSAIRKNLFEKVKDLAKGFNKNREQIQATVKEIFGEVTDELEKDYVEIRSHILAAVDEIEDKAKYTKRKYEDLVEDTVHEFVKDRDWNGSSKKNLIESLKNEWENLKASFEETEEEARAA